MRQADIERRPSDTIEPSGRWTSDVNWFKTWWVRSFFSAKKKGFQSGWKNIFRDKRGLCGLSDGLHFTLHSPAYMNMHFGSKFGEFFSELNIKYKTILHNASENKKKKSSNKPQKKS